MDSGSKTGGISKLGRVAKPFPPSVEDITVDLGSTIVYNKTVKLRSTLSARLEYRGQVSGKLYAWNQAGSIVEVDEADSGILLAKRRGQKTCCGNSKDGHAIFELVKE